MTADDAAPPPEDADRLERLIRGYQFTQALRVAAELQVPDLVADGALPLDVLVVRTGAHPPSLGRLLRALTTIGVLRETEPDVFGPTSLSDALRTGTAGSRRDWLLLNATDLAPTWAALGHSVRTGATATSLVYGMDSWSWRQQHPEQGARFDAAMSDISRRRAAGFVTACDAGRYQTVVDVGGGRGELLAALLRASTHLRGVLLDLPHVVVAAPALLANAGVVERVTVVAGDFFAEVPSGADAYVLSMVLHDWDDDRCTTILERCRAAMHGDAVLLLHERVLPNGPDRPWDPYFSDLNMLQGPGGQERNEQDWHTLLATAGFLVRRIVPTSAGNGIGVIEARVESATST